MINVKLISHPIDMYSCLHWVQSAQAGGINIFIGTVREFTNGKRVLSLEFEAYEKMALAEMAKIVGSRNVAVGEHFGLGDIAVGTAVGYLSVRFQELPWRTLYPELALFNDRLDLRPSFKDSVPYAQTITAKIM